MSQDIRDILERLDSVAKPRQLPALFQPRNASPALDGPYAVDNVTRGYLVGEDESQQPGTVFEPGIERTSEYRQGYNSARDAQNPHQEGTTPWTRWLKGRMDKIGPKAAQGGFMKSLQEEMTEIEEDMLSKVKKDLTQYLDRLEKKMHVDRDLRDKAVDAVQKGRAEEDQDVAEDPTAQDSMTSPPPSPQQDPTLPEAAAVKTITLEDGAVFEIHGDQEQGFEVRHRGRCLPTRFPKIDHAQMAVDLFRSRRRQQDQDRDYLEER